jgi:hypothetical protein
MNCRDCEQLFDAYLDGELGGAMRLEFDAHRLRCPQCERSLAMMQSIGSAIAANDVGPALSADFADRVMAQIAARQPAIRRQRAYRLVAGGVGGIGIAAAFFFALRSTPLPSGNSQPLNPPQKNTEIAAVNPLGDLPDKAARAAAVRELLSHRMEDRLITLHDAGKEVTAEFLQWKQYFNNVTVPEYIARAASQLADAAPMNLFQLALPDNSEDIGTDSGVDEYSL